MFVGFGIAGTGFGVVLGLLAELLRLNRGLFALGLTTAAGSRSSSARPLPNIC